MRCPSTMHIFCAKTSSATTPIYLLLWRTTAAAFVVMPKINCRGVKNIPQMVSRSISEDSPLYQDVLDELKTWAIQNRGKYDMLDFQNAINTLRSECQFNIHTLEKEVAFIQQTLHQQQQQQQQQQMEYNQSDQCNDDAWTSFDGGDAIPPLKAIFVGYQVTEYDRERLNSAHPEDHF